MKKAMLGKVCAKKPTYLAAETVKAAFAWTFLLVVVVVLPNYVRFESQLRWGVLFLRNQMFYLNKRKTAPAIAGLCLPR